MNKFFSTRLLTASMMALSLGLAGCLTDDDGNGPEITMQPQSVSAAAGDTITASVTASGEGLEYLWIFTVDGVADTLDETTATISTTARVSMHGGELVVVVSNDDGSVTSEAATVTITGLTDWPGMDTTLTVGAQGAAEGSVVDLDSGVVMASAEANANQAKIDLVYLYYNGTATLNGARAARDSGVAYEIGLTDGYDTTLVKEITMVRVASKPVSQEHAELLHHDGEPLRATAIAAGDKFVVLSSEDVYMYVEVTSITGESEGTAGLSISIGSLVHVETE